MRPLPSLVILSLLAAPLALAKSPKKMSDGELLTELTDGDKAAKRVAAAEELGARRQGAAQLGGVCGADPEAEVCDAAISALVAQNATEGWEQLQSVFERSAASPEARLRALSILLEESPSHFDDAAPRMTAIYRGLSPALGEALFKGVNARKLSALDDAVLFASLDTTVDRSVRLAALDAADTFNHARLYETYVSFLKDKDRDLRVRCAEGLGDSSLPGSVVVPALEYAAGDDPEGSVRAAAMVSLRQFAHTELLADLIHDRLVNDSHPYAWESNLELLVILADESSLKPMYKALDEQEYMKPEYQKRMVSLIASMDNFESLGPIRALEQRHQGTPIAEHCREVQPIIDDEFQQYERPKPAVEFNVWVPGSPDPHVPALQVQMGSNNALTGKGL